MKKIVVGVDGSEQSRLAMDWAWDEALLTGAELQLVHAWVYPYMAGHRVTVTEPTELVKLDAARLLEAEVTALTARKSPGSTRAGALTGKPPTFHALLREGSPADELLGEAKDAQLVVVGSRGRGGFLSLMLGSVAHQVSSHAQCPVVIVRAPRDDAH
jgi:nucleotide-binding universal stress UspA family protein